MGDAGLGPKRAYSSNTDDTQREGPQTPGCAFCLFFKVHFLFLVAWSSEMSFKTVLSRETEANGENFKCKEWHGSRC